MNKTEIKALSDAELIWYFATWSQGNPIPTKKEKQTVDWLMQEISNRGMATYKSMVDIGKKMLMI